MIPLRIGPKPLNVPTGWHEVRTARWLAWSQAALTGGDLVTTTAALLGIDEHLLASARLVDAPLLFGPLSFLIEPMPEPQAWETPVEVGTEAYIAVEAARLELRRQVEVARLETETEEDAWAIAQVRALPRIWAILTERHQSRKTRGADEHYSQARAQGRGVVALELPVTQVVPAARKLLASLLAFFEMHASVFEPGEEDDAAVEAGVHRFERYSHLMSVSVLCDNDPTRFGDVYQQPAHNVYLALAIRRDQADYATTLNRIHAERQPAP